MTVSHDWCPKCCRRPSMQLDSYPPKCPTCITTLVSEADVRREEERRKANADHRNKKRSRRRRPE